MSEPACAQRVTIRPYQPADLDALYEVCLQTGRDGGDATPLYRDHKLLGHVHAAPYALFEPSLAFGAEDEAGGSGYWARSFGHQSCSSRASKSRVSSAPTT